ncbi:hypothetical protein BLX87_07275 [Bacillus sp. VT-16-64]|nr:hypothetical protein BLX87_07275 [Bacillus sp. VT-16-64]
MPKLPSKSFAFTKKEARNASVPTRDIVINVHTGTRDSPAFISLSKFQHILVDVASRQNVRSQNKGNTETAKLNGTRLVEYK